MSFALFALLQAAPHGEMNVGSGRIVGGWEFVWAGYGIAFVSLALYTLSLWLRRPRASDPSAPPTP